MNAPRLPGALDLRGNPIFVMCCRQRLRPRALVLSVLITLIITGLVFTATYFTATERGLAGEALAARGTFVPLLFIQGILLILLGSGSVASGIAHEREDGVIDYHRMTPMTPTAKIVGYLLGLPIREYLMFAVTVPFTIFCVVKGELSWLKTAQLYLVFFTSVWLYHLTGLVAGLVAARPRRAVWTSRMLVIGLYVLFPQLTYFGFSFLGYLTFIPAFNRIFLGELSAATSGLIGGRLTVDFFTVSIDPTLYTLLVQGLLLATLFGVVHRKWRSESRPAFSRPFALGFYAGFQALVTGSLWPFLTQRRALVAFAQDRVAVELQWVAVLFLYLGLSAVVMLLVIPSISPEPGTWHAALRRARKRGLTRLPWHEDGATSTATVLLLAAITAASYLILTQLAVPEHAAPSFSGGPLGHAVVLLTFLGLCLVSHAVVELWGTRALHLVIGLLWFLPAAIGLVLVSAWGLILPAAYLAAATPPAACLYGLFLLVENQLGAGAEAVSLVGHLPVLAGVSLVAFLGLGIWLEIRLRRAQRQV
jgi:hypothetical protein